MCPSKKNARPCTHVETLVARWKSRGPPVDTRALHAGKLVAEWFRVSVGSPSSWGRRGEEKEDGGGKRARNFLRERKKDAREKKTYVLVCGVRSLCRRFLNQLATWVKVRPVSLAKFFFSSESGYFVLM